jgi:16S rRNA (guanine966-N2)-methyltransferase
MTRIVAGRARGRRLAVPPRGTRPTSDRTREALFNTLATEVELDGARVLDLFAGSGAVGFEALSRGAAAAVLVESDRRAAAVVADNARTLGLPGATVHRGTAAGYLTRPATDEPAFDVAFDLVFADPPYELPAAEVDSLLRALAAGGWLAPGAVVVIERRSRDAGPRWPNEIKAIKQRRYGEACLWYGRRQ